LELVAEITTTFDWFLESDPEVWKKRVEDHVNSLAGLYDGDWSNENNKVALGVRILFSPILLGLAIAVFFLWMLPITWIDIILDRRIDRKKRSASSSSSEWSGLVLDIVRRGQLDHLIRSSKA
jgi:hypothetical protein